MNAVAVLGRGQSLKEYPTHSSKFQTLYLVNNFNLEIAILGNEHFEGKDVVHVVVTGDNASFKSPALKLFRSIRIQCNCIVRHNHKIYYSSPIDLLSDEMLRRGYPQFPQGEGFRSCWEEILSHAPRFTKGRDLVAYLEKEHVDFLTKKKAKQPSSTCRMWPTTGLLAIELALVQERPDQLYLFGFDFYEKPYLVKKSPTATSDTVAMMKYHLRELVREFDRTEFFGSTNVDSDASNWHRLKEAS